MHNVYVLMCGTQSAVQHYEGGLLKSNTNTEAIIKIYYLGTLMVSFAATVEEERGTN